MSKAVETFLNFISHASGNRIGKYCLVDLQVEGHCPEEKDGVYSPEMGLIMLWGGFGALTLKLHFDLPVAAKYAAKSFGQSPEEITPKTARELILEMGNLQAGYLRSFFLNNQVPAGMSLPFLAKGEDEMVFRKIRDPRGKFFRWKLISELGVMDCTAEFLLLDSKIIDGLIPAMEAQLVSFSEKVKEDDGDIEFM